MALPKNFDDWQFTKKVILIGHNRAVKKYFNDVRSDTSRANGRQALKTSLLIRPNDSGIEILNKQVYFRFGLSETNIDTTLSIPESWLINPIGNNIPQLIVIYRGMTERTGNYSITIPHYSGNRTPKMPTYTKGNTSLTWTLKDGTRLILNVKNESEGRTFLNKIRPYIPNKYHTDIIRKVVRKGIKIRVFKPIRADFYPKGKEGEAYPLWRHYYS